MKRQNGCHPTLIQMYVKSSPRLLSHRVTALESVTKLKTEMKRRDAKGTHIWVAGHRSGDILAALGRRTRLPRTQPRRKAEGLGPLREAPHHPAFTAVLRPCR